MFDISPEEAQRRVADGALLIDVREQDEWEEAHVAEARHIPLAELAVRVAELPKDRDVVLMCHSGGRSARARTFLAMQGFERVYNLDGGIVAWIQRGLPVVA